MKIKQFYLFLVILFIVVVSGIGFGGWSYVKNTVEQPSVPDNLTNYNFVIEEGEAVSSIIMRLVEMGVIENDWPLNIYLYLNPGLSQSIQAGQYQIAPGLSMVEVIQSFKDGHVQGRLTFLEGWRREEYARYLIGEMGEDFAREFLEKAAGLDGMLFPDTYFVDDTTTPEILVSAMLANYNNKIGEIEAMGLIENSGLTEEEILIIASIIEREVPEPVDQVLVADIMIRRYLAGGALDADATVQYMMADIEARSVGQWGAVIDPEFNWWPREITFADLDTDSPYNTRKNAGLPPSPIANPGLNALVAVVEPLSNSYWFYLSDQERITRYAESLDEHNQNIAQYGVSQ